MSLSEVPDAFRDYVLLIYLSGLLGRLGGELNRFENVGIDYSECDPSMLLAEMPRSADVAIERIRQVSDDVWRGELISTALVDTELKRRSLIHLHEVHEAIGQADQPAQMALHDGFPDEAIAICSDALARAWNQCGLEIQRLAAECSVQARLLFPNGCKIDEVIGAFGYDPFGDKKLATIPTLELAELLKTPTEPESGGKPQVAPMLSAESEANDSYSKRWANRVRWLIDEVFAQATYIATELAPFRGGKQYASLPAEPSCRNPADPLAEYRGDPAVEVGIGKVVVALRESRNRMLEGLRRADSELESLPSDVADEVRHLQRIVNGAHGKIGFADVGTYYADSDLAAVGRRGWEAVLRYIKPLPFPSAGHEPAANGTPDPATARNAGSATPPTAETGEPTGEIKPHIAKALELVKAHKPIKGILLARKLGIKESTLRKHYIPKLKQLGVERSADGYTIDDESRSAT